VCMSDTRLHLPRATDGSKQETTHTMNLCVEQQLAAVIFVDCILC
jgi:hypothetical protein